jgi:hypothetical protein
MAAWARHRASGVRANNPAVGLKVAKQDGMEQRQVCEERGESAAREGREDMEVPMERKADKR